jgi:hypothetical protein
VGFLFADVFSDILQYQHVYLSNQFSSSRFFFALTCFVTVVKMCMKTLRVKIIGFFNHVSLNVIAVFVDDGDGCGYFLIVLSSSISGCLSSDMNDNLPQIVEGSSFTNMHLLGASP